MLSIAPLIAAGLFNKGEIFGVFFDDFAFGIGVDKPAVFLPSSGETVPHIPAAAAARYAVRVNFHA